MNHLIEESLCIRLIEDKLYFHLSKGTLYLRCAEILQICLVEETLNNDLVEEAFYDCLIKDLTSNCLVEEVSSKRLVEAVFGDHLITETFDRLTEDNLEIRLFEDFHNRIFLPSETTASTRADPDATSSSQIQAPFEVTYTGYHDPGQDHELYPEYFFTTVSDPVTNTTTGCLFYHVYVPHNRWPSIWTYCQDPTFAIKMAYYSWDRPSWGLEFRHQYQE
ncbi:hypothetical protein D6C80_00892 [Aureobasidium pullulans]|nr:hypothetical protein D6C80_00892 [Aureobasidium pullulans]